MALSVSNVMTISVTAPAKACRLAPIEQTNRARIGRKSGGESGTEIDAIKRQQMFIQTGVG
jgi:hypothetical protein